MTAACGDILDETGSEILDETGAFIWDELGPCDHSIVPGGIVGPPFRRIERRPQRIELFCEIYSGQGSQTVVATGDGSLVASIAMLQDGNDAGAAADLETRATAIAAQGQMIRSVGGLRAMGYGRASQQVRTLVSAGQIAARAVLKSGGDGPKVPEYFGEERDEYEPFPEAS